MSFENLDQNFEKVAQNKNEHTSSVEQDAMKHAQQQHNSDKEKYEKSFNDTSGLLSMFQKKLEQSTKERIKDGSEFDTISVTSNDIITKSNDSTKSEVSKEEIADLLSKKSEPINEESKSVEKNPISNLVVEQTNVQIVDSKNKTNDIKPKQNTPQDLVVDRTRYGDQYPEMNKRAQTSDGLSQQAIIRAANGESVNGMPGGNNDEVDDYITQKLKAHNENKLKKAQQGTDKNSSGSFSETIITDHQDEPEEITESILKESDVTSTQNKIENSD
jgi:hypothetical protein